MRNKTKIFIFSQFATFAILFYLTIGAVLVNTHYTKPRTIKQNQKLAVCNATTIVYELSNYKIINDKYYNEYIISEAYDSHGNDITNIFSSLSCVSICPPTLLHSCWTYKKYFAKYKSDIDAKFHAEIYILWFTMMPFCICFVLSIAASIIFPKNTIDVFPNRA
jgi:hypothetical protein